MPAKSRKPQAPEADVLSYPPTKGPIRGKTHGPLIEVEFQCDFAAPSHFLATPEKATLEECEAVIEKGWVTFVEVGRGLMTIRDRRLYRTIHPTFEAYCLEKWHYQKSHAYRLIAAAEVIECLSPIGDIPRPTHESQIRPLAGLPPDQVVSVWKEAIAKASGAEVTAKLVRKAAVEVLGTKPGRRSKLPPKAESDTLRMSKKHLENVLKLIDEAELAVRERKQAAVIMQILQKVKGLLNGSNDCVRVH